MNYLVDTQSVIWFAENNPLLSRKAREIMEDQASTCFVSMASFWEISIKMRLGKLDIKGLNLPDFWDKVVENGFLILDIRRDHVLENEKLALFHRDPFDRMLIAQALHEGLTIVTQDRVFSEYPVQLMIN